MGKPFGRKEVHSSPPRVNLQGWRVAVGALVVVALLEESHHVLDATDVVTATLLLTSSAGSGEAGNGAHLDGERARFGRLEGDHRVVPCCVLLRVLGAGCRYVGHDAGTGGSDGARSGHRVARHARPTLKVELA